ncbi:LamG domain-containing protein [Catenovulum maritimum]|uniref:LamG-like jellyroll fold domain-containing protein n=1 Tax=Catenovulum maritimum TaxID=1513271 RepID=A0A0J8GSL1_9ALTE|nr:LamG domain-containing protein [Catenovulum maritimum]KMT63693.1 hypothetical protein XM47_18385 [Catenovulum maritimum]
MTQQEQFPEVSAIADAVCSGNATPEQMKKLEQLLQGNVEAQQFYYDYINIHARLSATPKQGTAVVYRRITEELVIKADEPTCPEEQPSKVLEHQQPKENKNNITTKNMLLSLLAFIVIVASLFWIFAQRTSPLIIANIIDGKVTVVGQGDIQDNALLAGVYLTEQQVIIKLLDGDILRLGPNSLIKLFNNREVRLRAGTLSLEATTKTSTLIHTPAGMLHSNGSDLTVDLRYTAPRVTSGKNTVLVPARWRPKHFWPFNTNSDRVVDSAGSADGVMATGAIRVQGLVGQGAIKFDNSDNARIDLGNGGSTVRGTGSFSAPDGVTIETLIRPELSGASGKIQQIFRKDSGGGRIQLSFERQADHSRLSFGLFTLGHGYDELTLQLDGRDGRFSLADLTDGNYHHIAATYNADTGEKAIYINGKKQIFYQYPPGSKMVSGGPGSAMIGNTPRKRFWDKEAFSGVIDEVAFYDFALTEYAINLHLNNIKQGFNYYGLPANTSANNITLPERPRINLMPNTTYELSPTSGLPKKIIAN